jgi:hypothetical protein
MITTRIRVFARYEPRGGAATTFVLGMLLLTPGLVGTGCATYPLGLSREQWESLPLDQQAEYRARQTEVDELRRREQAARAAERRSEQEAAARAERERILALYQEARYGDIVRVSIQGGLLKIYKNFYRYHPVAFELVRGERKHVPFTRNGKVAETISFSVRLSEDGNMLYFDDDNSRQVVFANYDWERGQTGVLTSPRGGFGLEGASIIIKYKELPGAPQRLIIERR